MYYYKFKPFTLTVQMTCNSQQKSTLPLIKDNCKGRLQWCMLLGLQCEEVMVEYFFVVL